MAEEAKKAEKKLPTGAAVELRRARQKAGLTHSELHRLTGLSRTVLIGYEEGRTRPGEREIKKLCDALRVTPNLLIYGTEQPFEPDEALKRLGLDAESVGVAHLMVLFNMLPVEDRRAVLTLMHSILEARHGREWFGTAVEMMKVLEKFIPSVMGKLGFSKEGLEAEYEKHAPELEAEATQLFAKFAKPSKAKGKRSKKRGGV